MRSDPDPGIRGHWHGGSARLSAAAALVAGTALMVQLASAGETELADISFSGSTYTYTFTSVLDGNSEAVRTIVTDYDHLDRINDSITESRVLERYGPGELKRILRVRQCVLMFCFKLHFVERISETANVINATIVPGEGNFLDGIARWSVEPAEAGRTRMTLYARQTPDFWIPPIIGPMIMKRVFVKEVNETSENIERLIATSATPE